MNSVPSPELRPRLWDALVVLAVALLAIGSAVWFYGGLGGHEDAAVVITHQGTEVARFPLSPISSTREVVIDGTYHLTVTSDGEQVWVSASDCPTQDCVRTGAISRPGQSIVCLPEQVIVKLIGTGDGPDLVIG